MEQLNKVELVGVVGAVRKDRTGNNLTAHFSVVTNYTYKDREGQPVIETTWHAVRAFSGKDVNCLEALDPGARVKVVGRLRNCRYTDNTGADRTATEVYATSLKILDVEPLEMQTS